MIAKGTAVPASLQANAVFDVGGGLVSASRDGTPLVEFSVGTGGGNQAVDVAMLQRFQADVFAFEDRALDSHGIHYAIEPACQPQRDPRSVFG